MKIDNVSYNNIVAMCEKLAKDVVASSSPNLEVSRSRINKRMAYYFKKLLREKK